MLWCNVGNKTKTLLCNEGFDGGLSALQSMKRVKASSLTSKIKSGAVSKVVC